MMEGEGSMSNRNRGIARRIAWVLLVTAFCMLFSNIPPQPVVAAALEPAAVEPAVNSLDKTDSLHNNWAVSALRPLDTRATTGNGVDVDPDGNGGGAQPEKRVVVSFRLIGDSQHDGGVTDHGKYVTWIPTKHYVFEGVDRVSIYDLFVKALNDAGFSYEGAEKNYVSSIRAPAIVGGYWLSEFSNGPNSGWMYTVDGVHPGFGLKEYYAMNGQSVVWHYVDDFKRETGFEGSKPDFRDRWLEAADMAPQKPADTTPPTGEPPADAANNSGGGNGGSDGSDGSGDAVSAGVAGSSGETPGTSNAGSRGTGSAVAATPTVRFTLADKTTLSQELLALIGEHPVWNLTLTVDGVPVRTVNGVIAAVFPYGTPTGADSDLLTVYHIDRNGKAVELNGASYDSETGIITFESGHYSNLFLSEWLNPFEDFRKDDWFYKAVRYCFSAGLMSGTSETRFEPELHLTRAMLVTILYRNEGGSDGSGNSATHADVTEAADVTDNTEVAPIVEDAEVEAVADVEEAAGTTGAAFTDVLPGQWYTDAIKWAANTGIVKGYGDGTFGVNDNVTREQLAVVLYQYAAWKKHSARDATALTADSTSSPDSAISAEVADSTSSSDSEISADVAALADSADSADLADLAGFTDAAEISEWARSAMRWANAAGLINGRTQTTLAPAGHATRAETAALLMRFLTSAAVN